MRRSEGRWNEHKSRLARYNTHISRQEDKESFEAREQLEKAFWAYMAAN